ncbi:hypothetical protein Aspvir_000979 [Aspergillus viridinutans]|uniref:Uncharacterized protein n=1 Tax=Aspergillus viridinutans TaxID=75553 RepID=A0A9P3EZ44_ASPVI|nr:uncharacterized protein Aspvir_000979 [Aspergillus viridinutans]GIJ98858.1 hypothetical protein Aspvir_000979 [Aspergillus viridinutans]
MAYYTYLSLKRPGDGNDDDFNWIVTSTDRNTADTLFRILLENKQIKLGSAKTKVINIYELNRQSSRLWTINCDDGDVGATLHFALSGKNDPGNTAEGTVLKDLIGKIKIYWMGGRAGLQWRVIAQQTAVNVDDDWLSGYSFFIRRRGYPNSYWYQDQNGTWLSDHKRTRFVVTIIEARVMSATIPLIASDKIVISTLGPGGELQPIRIHKSGSGTVQTFLFGDLLTSFNVDNNDRKIVFSEPGRGDSFELCEGIAYNP